MPIQRLQVASSGGGNTALSTTIPSANQLYLIDSSGFSSAVWTVSCSSGVVTKVQFFNGTSLMADIVTTNGSVAVNLSTKPTRVYVSTNSGSNQVVTFTLTATAITNSASGTLDTITSSTTYTQSGMAYVVVVGGGGQGGGYGWGGGGGSGGIYSGIYNLTGNTAVTIGAGGANGNYSANTQAANGGSTIFGTITCTGGQGGMNGANSNATAGGGGGGTPNGGSGNGGRLGSNQSPADNSAFSSYPFVQYGCTGGGNGSCNYGQNGRSGDTIGYGGYNNGGTPASGYGAGGSGNANSSGGTAGTQGIVYVLRNLGF